MSIKILIDMNLSLDWVPRLNRDGWSATHWSTVGDPKATDRSIMDGAEANGYVAFTHDLDFGTLLALTHKNRTEATSPFAAAAKPAAHAFFVAARMRSPTPR